MLNKINTIKKTWTKSERKKTLNGCFENLEGWVHKSRREREKKRFVAPNYMFIGYTRCLGIDRLPGQFKCHSER
jgi:hypothetical protein